MVFVSILDLWRIRRSRGEVGSSWQVDMEHEHVGRVLDHIDSKCLEIGRLILNKQRVHALQRIREIKRNLLRIRSGVSNATFVTICSLLDNLANICETEEVNRLDGNG